MIPPLPHLSPSNAATPALKGAHLMLEAGPSFAWERVGHLDSLPISGTCPVMGPYEGALRVKVDRHSQRVTIGTLVYRIELRQGKNRKVRWLTEAGLQALELVIKKSLAARKPKRPKQT